jgi:hypothetical protein
MLRSVKSRADKENNPMPLSWNEIKDRALAFSREWADESSERAEAKSFWDAFFNVFGVSRRKVATFEEPARRLDASRGYIDLFWRGMLVVEHKSRGKDLDRAYGQAIDYLGLIPERDLPRYVLVSDFARFRLYDLESGEHWEFALKDLHRQARRFGFIAGYSTQEIKEQDPVNVKAAERMGSLHDQLKASGFEGHPLEVCLVRLLFCLFADDTGIFQPRSRFRDWLETRTAGDGSDLGALLGQLFQVLNTPEDRRQTTLDEDLAGFPYVNGRLFEETLPLASFDADMRAALLDCAGLDWSRISPAVFGALFQSVMNTELRRNLGAHYTSEKNILKLIKPLFLDDLWEEFRRAKGNVNRLFEFHKKLATLRFLDPACGCGNFLVISYRELRLLELEILRTVLALQKGQQFVEVFGLVKTDVDQFYGIELEEFPAQIAQVALWLMDHQMNLGVSEEFGMYFARLPLKKSPTVVHGNALQLDWADVVPPEKLSFILGNPPFVGSKYQSDPQRAEIAGLFRGIPGAGILDYVSGWYLKAANYIRAGGPEAEARIRCALVSTNSITQGEQAGVLWSELLRRGAHIHFAHRTFRWSNEARGIAAVHCVIVGFALHDAARKTIFDYDDPRGEPHAQPAANINPYLADAPDIVLPRRDHPLCDVPEIGIGNKPIDDGNYLFTPEEKAEFLHAEPRAARWFRRWIGSDEFINGYERWCLWLGDCPPEELRRMPEALKRVEAVRAFRLTSRSAPTRKLAETPTRFHVENIPDATCLVIPEVSSERRRFIPMGFVGPDTLCSNLVKIAPGATLFHFGVLGSTMHMAWVRYTCGRLESRYRYSKDIVYNNFPWPKDPEARHLKAIEEAAQGVLEARAQFPGSSLADLYDPLTMPPALTRAHQALDRAVDAAYLAGAKARSFANDAERVAFLFRLYQQYTSLLPAAAPSARKRGRRTETSSGA